MAQLVIIRGNFGSGKTSLAKKLQNHFGRGTLVISQDLVRREMLKEKGKPDNLSIFLTETIAHYGYGHDLLVILEGFYETNIYGDMLECLRRLFDNKVLAYYYDLSFEETVRRHATRSKVAEFGPADMRRWWLDKDVLGWKEEILFTDDVTLEQAFEQICQQIER